MMGSQGSQVCFLTCGFTENLTTSLADLGKSAKGAGEKPQQKDTAAKCAPSRSLLISLQKTFVTISRHFSPGKHGKCLLGSIQGNDLTTVPVKWGTSGCPGHASTVQRRNQELRDGALRQDEFLAHECSAHVRRGRSHTWEPHLCLRKTTETPQGKWREGNGSCQS